ncbi:M96 mating-specific protein family [Phytophthora cinnamomi]|uniref:M96 mating-specific protein family n=1 Tax=Phytophthora cinnamomi TaxID=4785 RepID=UPI00355AB2C4|nr:M96 mating-specific protein family [Phytophthora cinnamomi]
MPLLLGDDEVEALEAALSYVDTLPPSDSVLQDEGNSAVEVSAAPAARNGAAGEGEVRLDAELDRLLLETLSSSSEHDSDSTSLAATSSALTAVAAASRHVLPTPLPPMVTNVGASDVSRQSRHGSRAAKSATTTLAKTKRRVKVNPNRARDERKHELAYLRNKVEQMERELDTMRHRRRVRGICNGEPPPSSSGAGSRALTTKTGATSSRMPFIWRDIATRQQQRREKSERENARLKLVLESQVKLAKSMETLLQKRARQQVSGCAEVVGASGDLSSQGSTLDFLVDKDTFEALLTSVETAYAELDAVFATNGLLDLDTPCRDARMREGASGMYLDVFANKVLPFSYDAVTTAVWNHFRGDEKHRGVVYENATKHLETSSDTIMEAFTMEFLGKTTTADFRVKQVIRRFVETDKQVVVWVSIGQALDPNNSPFSSFGFVDKGYVVTRRPTSIAPGHGEFTILQMCSLVSPQMAAGCRIDMTAAGDFTEFVLNVVAANTTTSQELIENVLLDQALDGHQESTSLAA